MSYQEKNVAVTLASFSLILVIVVTSLLGMLQNDTFNSSNVFRLWGISIVLAIVFTIFATVLTHVVSAIIEAIRTGSDDPKIEDFEDERDRLIDLRGTKLTYGITSGGGALAMLTYVLGQSPLVMFTLLLVIGVVAQVIGDIYRLILYRRGF